MQLQRITTMHYYTITSNYLDIAINYYETITTNTYIWWFYYYVLFRKVIRSNEIITTYYFPGQLGDGAQLARFCASSGPSNWAALTHLIGYLIHRPSLKITYHTGSTGGLDGFADPDWGNRVSRKSATGLVARYNRTPVLWRSNIQKTIMMISLSSAEAGYY